MFDQSVIEAWAAEYDAEVAESDLKDEYPFAGYQNRINSAKATEGE